MEALESTLTTKGSCAEVTRKGARMPWLVKEDIQRGLFHKEPEIPIIQNSFQNASTSLFKILLSKLMGSRSSRIVE